MINKCFSHFQSQYAYLDNKPIHINDYKINQILINRKNDLRCRHGHDLIAVTKSNMRKSHFRHKYQNDIIYGKMSEWHILFQGEFKITEFTFGMIYDQIKERRADVYIPEYNLVLEFQHSKITKDEVSNRNHDYKLHNINVIWIIDGNLHINKTELENGRIFLTFDVEWLYESFSLSEIIYIDHEDQIYKIYPSYVKNKMVDVDKPFDKTDFIKMIQENNQNLYKIDIPTQCNLYINQLGAGNGKTYGIIQKLQSDDFSHYKEYIIVTKQHSAKEIIYRELQDQIKNGHLQFISDLKFLNKVTQKKDKKYILSYTNTKVDAKCKIIICTIDSLMFKLGDSSSNGTDLFTNIIQSIIDDYMDTAKIYALKYSNAYVKLNKEICLIIDETQDLPEIYAKALIKIMRGRYVDAYIVGDKLQSISHDKNAFNYFENELSYINKILPNPTNICRRFIDKTLVDFCNAVINFDEYNLPKIEPYTDPTNHPNSLNLIQLEDIKEDKSKIEENINKIMEKYTFEVEQNNCQPNDFLFVTPFTTSNYLVDSVEIAINKFWNNKNNNKEYFRYALFHKSELGSSIDTTLSNDSTRIVSIHSAKGDGRKIVFVIGCDEKSLKKFSKGQINLIYESMFHVAITRMKQKLYFTYIPNSDNIHQRITEFAVNNNIEIEPYIPNINQLTKKIKYDDIIQTDTNDDVFNVLKKHIMKYCDYNDCVDLDKHQIIDMQHHKIRGWCMKINFWLKIIKRDEQTKNQLKIIFKNTMYANISDCLTWKEYNKILQDNKTLNNKTLNSYKDINTQKNNDFKKRNICVLIYNEKDSQYKTYFGIIRKNIELVRQKLKKIVNNSKEIYLCPFESIILYYMYTVCEFGKGPSDITITELYDITHVYYNSFSHEIEMHTKCECKNIFPNKENAQGKLYDYLLSHYEKICIVNEEYDKFLNNNPNLHVVIRHSFGYKDNEKVTNSDEDKNDIYSYLCVGHNNNNCYNIIIYPSFNKLNHNAILIRSMYETYLLYNRNNSKDDHRINDKDVKTVLFTCDTNKHYIFDWKNDSIDYILENKTFFKYRIREYIVNLHLTYVKYFYYSIKNEYNNSQKNKISEKIKEIKEKKIIINVEKNIEANYYPPYVIVHLDSAITLVREYEKKKNISDIESKINEYIFDYESFREKINEEILEYVNKFLKWEDKDEDFYYTTYENKNPNGDPDIDEAENNTIEQFNYQEIMEPILTEPILTEPILTEPILTEPILSEPILTEPILTESILTEPILTEPILTEPILSEPILTEPILTEPILTESILTEPILSEPILTEPILTESILTEPILTESILTEPILTEPILTEPILTESILTEPILTEPILTEPILTDQNNTNPSIEDTIIVAKKKRGRPKKIIK
jgi:hypothetical protein